LSHGREKGLHLQYLILVGKGEENKGEGGVKDRDIREGRGGRGKHLLSS